MKTNDLRQWGRDTLNFLFPPTCHICDSLLAPHERFVCTRCLSELPRSGYHRRPLNPMEERFAGHFPFERATGHFFYTRDSSLSRLIQDMKYRGFPGIAHMLGFLVGSELYPTGFFDGVDAVVPVPMHIIKRMRRGYNQTDHIAKGVSEAIGVPVLKALRAVRGHRTQTALTYEERRENLAGIFRADKKVSGRHILLVDDICTTGSTLAAASEALWTAKPGALTLLTIGVTF